MSALFAIALVASACGQKETVVPRAAPTGLVSFDQDAAVASNGPIPAAVQVKPTCGSDTTTFGSELVDVPPQQAKVGFEWGAIAEDPTAEMLNAQRAAASGNTGTIAWPGIKEPKQMLISGTVRNVTLSTGDLTFNHPFGLDFTMDIALDKPYRKLALLLGQPIPDGPVSTLHMEIQQGLLPHSGPNLQDWLEGFDPKVGDRIAAFGAWIIDCGHDNWQSELHELTFIAYGHAEGDTTVSRAFYNPYRPSQYLAAKPELVNQLLDYTRWSDPTVKPFPGYLVQELLRVGRLSEPFHDRIEAHHMLKANYLAPAPWYVCAPGSGSTLEYSYSFTTRSGVSITASPDNELGCVKFTASIAQAYSPQPPNRRDCVNLWSDLNQQVQAALGNPDIDIRQLIEKQVPASFIPAVERDPVVDCYDPLQVGPPGDEAKRSVVRDDTQPFPFYGEVRVSWKK